MRIPIRLMAALLLVAGCKENPVEPQPSTTSFSFSYRLGNEASRSFSVQGQQAAGTSFAMIGAWVFTGSGGAPHSTLIVRPYQQTASGWLSFITYVPNQAGIDSIFLGDPAAGTCPGERNPCTIAIFRVESSAGAVLETCPIVDGKMVITRRTAEWVSGEVQGTGTCTPAGGGATRAFVLQNGTFDIALPPPASAPG
jgi:hypothetical protein